MDWTTFGLLVLAVFVFALKYSIDEWGRKIHNRIKKLEDHNSSSS